MKYRVAKAILTDTIYYQSSKVAAYRDKKSAPKTKEYLLFK